MSQAAAAELQQFLFGGLYARLHHHQRFRNFAPARIGHWDDCDFIDAGMGKHRLFHFERRNIFSAAHDDVLLAVHDQDVALFVHGGHIAGVEPAAAHNFGGSLRLFPVAIHDTVTAGHDFADGLAVAGTVIPIGVDHANFDARNSVPG